MSYFKLPLKPIQLLLILVGCVAVINATCENAHCPRFYNAECRDDHCESPPCDPHFFWRGRNVTLRCEAETCNTKTCADTRQCMEEVITRPCPPGSSICRQYLNTKCVLMPIEHPMSCSDITTCNPGTVCRIRERLDRPYPVIVCIPTEKQTSCDNIHCKPGFSCVDKGNTIMCVPSLTTAEPTTVEPTSAETTTAQQTTVVPTTAETTTVEPTTAETNTLEPTTAANTTAQETTADPTTAETNTVEPTSAETTTAQQTTATVEPTSTEVTTAESITTEHSTSTELPSPMGTLCDELTCVSQAQFCEIIQVPEYNFTTANCASQEDLTEFESLVSTNPDKTCDMQSCQEEEICIEFSGNNLDAGGYCSRLSCDQTDNSSCPTDANCIQLPVSFRVLGETACVPDTVDLRLGINCGSDFAPNCEPGKYCADIRLSGLMIGSFCSLVLSGVRTCDEIECPEQFVCVETSYESIPALKLAGCLPESDFFRPQVTSEESTSEVRTTAEPTTAEPTSA